MSTSARLLYSSANGDRWSLVHDAESGRVFVRHEPNLPSGGRTSDIDIGAFLAPGSQGPQHHELLRLIGTLVEPAAPMQMNETGSPESELTRSEPAVSELP